MNIEIIGRYIYALEKLAARDSFVDFLDNWGISDEEYREIKDFFKEQGIKGYTT